MGFPGNLGQTNIQFRDPVLTALIQGYAPIGFVADQILRRVPVESTFGRVGKWADGGLRLENDAEWAPGNIPETTFAITSGDTWNLGVHMERAFYDLNTRFQFGGDSKTQAIWAKKLADNLMIRREYTLANTLMSASIITQTSSPSPAWSDYTTSPQTILTDFAVARKAVYDGCGYEPNGVILSWDVWNVLRAHPTLVSIAYGFAFRDNFAGTLTNQKLAEAMAVERVLVPMAKYNSAKKNQTEIYTSVWPSGSSVFFYANPNVNPTVAQQSVGYSLVPATTEVGYEVFSYVEPAQYLQPWLGMNVIAGRMYDDHIYNPKAAYLYTGCI